MILSIYHEIVKMASQKKHYIMLIGYAFLMTLMVFVYWKFQNRFLGEAERMLQGMPYIMQKMIPDPSKLCDGLMFARFSCMILFWVVMPIFAFMFAGEAIACEQQDGTLRAYLSRGFSRTQFGVAKFIAVFLVILFYSMLFAALTMLIGIVFFGQFAPQLDGYIPAILLVAGVILFLVEIFVMPGTFLFGIGGIACMIIALIMSFDTANIPEYAASKYLIPLLPEGWTPMLKTDMETAVSPTEAVQEVAIGTVGTAKTFLRPVGQASFTMPDGSTKLFDVQTHGEIIEAGENVKIEAIQEGHIWVSRVIPA